MDFFMHMRNFAVSAQIASCCQMDMVGADSYISPASYFLLKIKRAELKIIITGQHPPTPAYYLGIVLSIDNQQFK